MQRIKFVLRLIDALSNWTAKIVATLVVLLTGVVCYEVLARYVFSAPTRWAQEMSAFSFGAAFILGGAYTLLCGAHVNMDIIYNRLRPRVKAILDLLTSTLFFAFVGVLAWKGWEMAWASVLIRERTMSDWGPPLYPIKMILAIGASLILLQGLAKFIRDLIGAIAGEKALRQVIPAEVSPEKG